MYVRFTASHPPDGCYYCLIRVNQAKVSLLSEEAPSQNYRGLLNLMAILLLVTNYRLIVDNLQRYGVLVSFPKLTEPHDLYDAPRVTGTLLLVRG